MIINKLYIKEYGKLKNFSLEFKEGLNIVYGKNESGKSTVLSFIGAMFYGLNSKKKNIKDNFRKKYLPWDSDKSEGSIFFKLDKNYGIKRKFGSKKSEDDTIIINNVTGEEVKGINLDKPLEDFIGINKQIFENTTFIKQLMIEIKKDSKDEIIKALTNLNQTGNMDTSYTQVINNLNEYKKAISNNRNNGKLDILKDKLNDIYQVYSKIKINYTNYINSNLEKLQLIEKELNFIETLDSNKEILFNELLIDKIKEEYLSLKQNQKYIENKNDEYKETLKSYNDISNKAENLKAFSEFDYDIYTKILKKEQDINNLYEQIKNIQNNKAKLEKLQIRKDEITNNLGDLVLFEKITFSNQEIYEKEEELKRINNKIETLEFMRGNIKKLNKNKLGLLFSILAVIISIIGGKLFNSIFYVASILGIISCIFNVYKMKNIKKDININNCKYTSKEMALIKHEQLFITNMLNNIYDSVNAKDFEEYEIKYKKYQGKKKTLDEINSSIDKIQKLNTEDIIDLEYEVNLKNNYINSILNKCNCKDKEEFADKLNKYKGYSLQVNNVHNEINKIKDSIKMFSIKNIEIKESILNRIKVLYENTLNIIENKIKELKKKINKYEEDIESIDIAQNTLLEAFEEIQNDFVPKLNKIAGKILNEITQGKYSDLRISENFNVKVINNNNISNVEYFSFGTLDQIYFSIRLAIAELIFRKNDIKIPIFLDDTFIQYDDDRLFAVLKYLIKYAKENQVIIFTCQKREIELIKEYDGVNIINI